LQCVGQNCLEFLDLDKGIGINLIPLSSTPAIPRPGDIVLLPGEFSGNENHAAGTYKVESIHFIYNQAAKEVDQPFPALLGKITVNVRKIISDQRQ
jgi:hypothetical protein